MHGILSCMNSDTPFEFGRLPRLTSWWVIALALSALVFLLAPQQLPVSIYKLNLIALAAVAGYWIDRSLFPYARPDLFFELRHGAEDAPRETTFTSLGGVLSFAEAETAINLEDARPDELMRLAGVSMIRRAAIVVGAMLAVGLGA